jgi:tRNA uridine 5-carboxymethylaminomethyl modification enzyme
LNGLVHIGDEQPVGRAGEPPTHELAESLRSFGFEMGRLKTGTPPRLHRESIDFSRRRPERGDDPIVPFRSSRRRSGEQIECHLLHTRSRARSGARRHHAVATLQRPDLGIGPRYARRSKTR